MHTGQTVSGALRSRRGTEKRRHVRTSLEISEGDEPRISRPEEASAGSEDRMNPETDKGPCWGGAQRWAELRERKSVQPWPCCLPEKRAQGPRKCCSTWSAGEPLGSWRKRRCARPTPGAHPAGLAWSLPSAPLGSAQQRPMPPQARGRAEGQARGHTEGPALMQAGGAISDRTDVLLTLSVSCKLHPATSQRTAPRRAL